MELPKQFMANYNCSVEVTLDVIGGKWKGIILSKLIDKTLRYSELKRYMPKITPRTLTRQLRELERDGLINRKVYPEVPPKVEYSVTDLGKTLAPIVKLLDAWGDKHIDTIMQNRLDYHDQSDESYS